FPVQGGQGAQGGNGSPNGGGSRAIQGVPPIVKYRVDVVEFPTTVGYQDHPGAHGGNKTYDQVGQIGMVQFQAHIEVRNGQVLKDLDAAAAGTAHRGGDVNGQSLGHERLAIDLGGGKGKGTGKIPHVAIVLGPYPPKVLGFLQKVGRGVKVKGQLRSLHNIGKARIPGDFDPIPRGSFLFLPLEFNPQGNADRPILGGCLGQGGKAPILHVDGKGDLPIEGGRAGNHRYLMDSRGHSGRIG